MRGANRHLKPVRPTVVSARDGRGISSSRFLVNADPAAGRDLQVISDNRPEVSAALQEMQTATLKLALMLPRPLLERLVECVIDWLDDLDGDPDLEPTDEREPGDGL